MTKQAVSLKELNEVAEQNARNLWQADNLEAISQEQWQRVLANVEARMRLRGIALFDDWQGALTRYVGRGDA